MDNQLIKGSLIRTCLWVLFLGFTCISEAQLWTEFKLTPRGDTINRIDQKKRKQGPWLVRYEQVRGEPGFEEEGYFQDDKKEGPWKRFSLMGDLIAREFYKGGYRDGKQQYYTRIGDLLREESWKSVDPANPYDTIVVPDLDNPNLMIEKVIKHEAAEVKNGTWTYYDPVSGSILKTENFIFGQPEAKLAKPIAAPVGSKDSLKTSPKPVPKEVQQFEQKKKGKG